MMSRIVVALLVPLALAGCTTAGRTAQAGLGNQAHELTLDPETRQQLDTMAKTIGRVDQQVSSVSTQVGANSGDNATTRLYVIFSTIADVLVMLALITAGVLITLGRRKKVCGDVHTDPQRQVDTEPA
ncbi:MAG: hypothetical protein GY778_13670 [bacterium]|nr:hypothetical protein [bacterium]